MDMRRLRVPSLVVSFAGSGSSSMSLAKRSDTDFPQEARSVSFWLPFKRQPKEGSCPARGRTHRALNCPSPVSAARACVLKGDASFWFTHLLAASQETHEGQELPTHSKKTMGQIVSEFLQTVTPSQKKTSSFLLCPDAPVQSISLPPCPLDS